MEKLDFNLFRDPVAKQFNDMVLSGQVLVRTNISGDALYEYYLDSYPIEHNGIFRERREYDGNYDKNFIRRIGNIVGIAEDGTISTIWDVKTVSYFQTVTDAMAKKVRETALDSPFLTTETQAGSKPTVDNQNPDIIWSHFFALIPSQFTFDKDRIGPKFNELMTDVQVFARGLQTFTLDAAETVLELIKSGSLYRGEEHKRAVEFFIQHKKAYAALPEGKAQWAYIYYHAGKLGSVVRFRPTVIGTLVEDLSNGVDLERAVASFESKVAPTNYKRSSSVVTPTMIRQAQEKLEELGLTDALTRRFATTGDLSADKVLFSSTNKKSLDVFDDLVSEASRTVSEKALKKVEEITADKFISDVLPTATSVELLVENKHKSNFMSLLTEKYPGSPLLFKWNNPFSWAYSGNITDSIKENVKKQGGAVEGLLRVSLAWYNSDDLDLSLQEPKGNRVYFGTRTGKYGCKLDIDANGGSVTNSTEPVENIIYPYGSILPVGEFDVFVDQFNKRVRRDEGFTLQVEANGVISNFTFDGSYNERRKKMLTVVHKGNNVFEVKDVDSSLRSVQVAGKEIWNVQTNSFVPVNTIINSPNFWEGDKGNKHTFFLIDGCKTDEETRGFFNEFLKEELNPHRKVFELLGERTKVQPTDDQLSGLGFSSTKRDEVTVRVSGKTKRTFLVKF